MNYASKKNIENKEDESTGSGAQSAQSARTVHRAAQKSRSAKERAGDVPFEEENRG